MREWFAKAWPWLKWVLVVVAAVVAWKILRAKLSSLLDFVSRPAKWSRIPGMETHVVALNPVTGSPETVELPAGVKARDVTAVGISEHAGGYEVEAMHTATNRHGSTGTGGDLSI